LINAVPTIVGGWQLDYAEGGLNMFNFTLHVDRWTVDVSTNGGVAAINGAAPTTKSTNK